MGYNKYTIVCITVNSCYSKPLSCGHFTIKATFYWHRMNFQCFMKKTYPEMRPPRYYVNQPDFFAIFRPKWVWLSMVVMVITNRKLVCVAIACERVTTCIILCIHVFKHLIDRHSHLY